MRGGLGSVSFTWKYGKVVIECYMRGGLGSASFTWSTKGLF